MSTNRKNISISRNGFTLVEMVIIAPIVILLIGGFISAIVSMTGAVIASRASSSLAINIQDALNRIDLDVKASNSLLATNSITPLISPQGYNNDTTGFKNVGTNGTMLIISSNATTGNPLNSSSKTVYWSGQPNLCNSSQVSSNTPVAINIVYFVKNNSLWRRTILPSGYATASCVNGALGQPWQRSSCAVSTGADSCKTQDEKLLTWTKSGSFAVDYFTSTDPVNPIAAASIAGNTDDVRLAAIKTASSIKATITATSTVAGRDVSQSGTIRSSSPNTGTTSNSLALSGSGGGTWVYKRPITVTNSSGSALTNYQIKLSLTTAALGNPYTHIKTDGSDVRFMDSNVTTEYSYWNEAWNNTSTSTIWVKIPSLATGDTTINMYYGNPSATNSSSGDNTFVFFDDFRGTTINATKWTELDTKNAINQNNGLNLTNVSTAWDSALISNTTFNRTVGLAVSGSFTAGSSVTAPCHMMVGWDNNQNTDPSYAQLIHGFYFNAGLLYPMYENGASYSASGTYAANSTNLFRVRLKSVGADYLDNGSVVYSGTGGNFTTSPMRIAIAQYDHTGTFNNIYVHQSAATEPTHAAPGAETAP